MTVAAAATTAAQLAPSTSSSGGAGSSSNGDETAAQQQQLQHEATRPPAAQQQQQRQQQRRRRLLLLAAATSLVIAAAAVGAGVGVARQRAASANNADSTSTDPTSSSTSGGSSRVRLEAAAREQQQQQQQQARAVCNGVPGLCDVPVRLATWPGTHNSFAVRNPQAIARAQALGFAAQLAAGARLFDLDSVGSPGSGSGSSSSSASASPPLPPARLGHCFGCLCSYAADAADADAARVFATMAAFLDANPRDVIAIGLSNVNCGDKGLARSALLAALAASPLRPYLATRAASPSTTVGQLVQSGQRAVLLFYDQWRSAQGWAVGGTAIPDQSVYRTYAEGARADGASDAPTLDALVGAQLTADAAARFDDAGVNPTWAVWRVMGLFPDSCLSCRAQGDCGPAACATKSNSEPYVTYLIGNVTAAWSLGRAKGGGDQALSVVPAYNALQADYFERGGSSLAGSSSSSGLAGSSSGEPPLPGVAAAARRLNDAFAALYAAPAPRGGADVAARLGLANCAWLLDDAAFAGGLLCAHHGRVRADALLGLAPPPPAAADSGGGTRRLAQAAAAAVANSAAARRLLVPANAALRVVAYGDDGRLRRTVAGSAAAVQLVDVGAGAIELEAVWQDG